MKIPTAYFIFLTLLLVSKFASPQSNGFQSSRPGRIVPSGFYIRAIIDERGAQDSTGDLLFSSNGTSLTHKITLKAGSFEGMKKLLISNTVKDTSLKPIIVRIKETYIREKLLTPDRVTADVGVHLEFDLIKESGAVPLTGYQASAKYSRSLNNLSIVEPTFRDLVLAGMEFSDKWLEAEVYVSPQLARGVKLSFREYQDQHDDTVYYDARRPLIWDDFREKRSQAGFAAAVFPSFGYEQAIKIEKGFVLVDLSMKVFVVKSASWVTPGTQTNYNLNHEQKHFDLVKLVSERFRQKLLSEKLTPDNYQGIINFEYLEFYREMNKLQKEYDDQTQHGTNRAMQALWDSKISADLKSVGN